MKKKLIVLGIAMLVVSVFLAIYPTIEIQTNNKLIAFRYTDDITEFESELSYNESYTYYADRDISIKKFEVDNFLFFYVITMEYIEGNYCDTQFCLEEDYINDFLDRAEIQDNENNINVKELITGRKAIVGNTRYVGNDYENSIYYTLDGKDGELHVFYVDDLLVIQVGSPDECPKFIAYK